MKTAASMFVYGIWFGLVLWLSYYNYWFLFPIRWMQDSLPNKSIPHFYMTIAFLLWLTLAFSLAWLPIWLGRKGHFEITKSNFKNTIFLLCLFSCVFLCTIIWDTWVVGRFYLCTDPLGFDFLHPGDWVWKDYVTVPKINPSDSMDKPDSVKEGWNVFKLWLLWWLFVAASLVISMALTFLIIRLRKLNSVQTFST